MAEAAPPGEGLTKAKGVDTALAAQVFGRTAAWWLGEAKEDLQPVSPSLRAAPALAEYIVSFFLCLFFFLTF